MNPDVPVDTVEVEARAAEEIVVWGRLATELARDAIVHRMEELGWEVVRDDDGRVVFRPPQAWMGRATLEEDGSFTWARPVAGLTTLPPETWAVEPSEPPDLHAPDTSVGAGPTVWVLPGRRKLDAVRARVLAETQPLVDRYVEIRRRTIFEEQIAALPDRLDALWNEGVALDGGPRLETPEQRRRAVLEYWATRAETTEGGRTAAVVGTWLGQVVEASEHPITAEERRTYRREDGHRLPGAPDEGQGRGR